MRVVRPKWTPRTEEQRRAIAAAKRAAKKADEAEGLMWEAVGAALDFDVPAAFMADVVGRSRTTLYRHVQHPKEAEAAAGQDDTKSTD